MEVNFWLVSLPAFVTLALKASIYAYARFSRVHNFLTRLYLLALFSFSVQNIAEIGHFYTFIKRGLMPNFEVNIFYASTIIAYAFLFHLVVALVFGRHHKTVRSLSTAIYVYALVLEVLLFFTPWLISGYTPIRNYTVTRIPGPLYGAFEFYAIGICLCMLGLLAYGVRHQASAYKRSQLKIILIAVAPLNLVLIAVLVALHTGVRLFNASVTMPAALTVFLILTAYATHQYRLFDIEFFIPWSRVRKRKTAFYDRIRTMIAEIADLESVGQAINRLADTLGCPVALVGGPQPVLALAGSSKRMTEFPLRELRQIETIVVANEVADTMPATHALLRQHGIAAIVPFYPRSRTAASWMLLGDSFSEQVYTPLDFKMVEQLFDRLGELFLDKLLYLRTQLHEVREQLQTQQFRLDVALQETEQLREQNALLRRRVAQVDREPPVADNPAKSPAAVVTLLPTPAAGDKPLAQHVLELEARMIEQALHRCAGNKAKAARLLGLRPNTLHYKIERYGLSEIDKD